jgi:DNA polymerase-4
MRLLGQLWKNRPDPRQRLLQVGVVLSRLCEHNNYTPPLFQTASVVRDEPDDETKHRRLDSTLDQLRARYGRSVVYFGNVQQSRDQAPMRISFTHIPDLQVEKD